MHSSPRFHAVSPRRALLFLLLLALACLHPSPASAAVPSYTGERLVGCEGERGGGQRDVAGNLYLTCNVGGDGGAPSIRIYDVNGTLTRTATVPDLPGDKSNYLSDVAPSPDGSYLYVAQFSPHRYYRLVRQADGSYAYDAGFTFEQFPYGPTTKVPQGEFLATDASGRIYIANGTWVGNTPMTVLQYDAQGRYLGRFGEDAAGSRKLGDFYWMLTDIAVTPDGATVYSTEVGNNRVQRWERTFATNDFTARAIYGNTAADDIADDPNQIGDQSRQTKCEPGKFGAPYASALDTAGNLYVINTNCWDGPGGTTQVQRLENGVWTVIKGPKYDYHQAHELAIDGRGNIYVPSVNVVFHVGGAVPAPAADTTAPDLSAATLPATTATRSVTLALTATDAVGVTQVRTANEDEDITAAAWRAWSPQLAQQLTAGDGAKTVSVQVRDAAGNLSSVLAVRTTYTAPVVVVPPVDVPPVVVPPAKVNAAPVLSDVQIADPAPAQTVTVSITATDDTKVTEMRLTNEGGVWPATWQSYSASTTFTLTAGAGRRGVFVQVRDAEGLMSAVLYRTTLAPGTDVVAPPVMVPAAGNLAPTLAGVTVPASTSSSTITVKSDATDDHAVTEMRFATEDGNWRPWQSYAASASVALTPGVGARGVFVQGRDAELLTSAVLYRTLSVVAAAGGDPAPAQGPVPVPAPGPGPVQAPPIGPDLSAPVLSSIALPATTASSGIVVTIAASDDRGVTGVRLANENGVWAGWRDFTPTVAWTLTQPAMTKGVFVQVRDAAGNESKVLFRTTLCAPCLAPAKVLQALRRVPSTSATAVTRRRLGSMRADTVRAATGSQHFDFSQADGRRDVIDCGRGYDTVLKRPEDRTRNCERVVVVRAPR